MPALSTLSRVTGLPSGAALLAAQPAGSGQGFVEVTPAQADVVAWLSFTPVSMIQLTTALAGVGSTYTLPAATTSTLGGVKPDGTTITVSAGIISAAGGGGSYTLPQATTTVLGGVKVDGTTITATSGVISLNTQSYATLTGITPTSATAFPAVNGDGTSGKVTIAQALALTPVATTSVAGIVKAGSGLAVAGDGTLSATGGGSAVITVSNTYTASGAIAPTDSLAIINASSTVAMTIANGTTDGHQIIVKRYGAGTAGITATIDGGSQTITMNSNGVKESLTLLWSVSLTSYVLI